MLTVWAWGSGVRQLGNFKAKLFHGQAGALECVTGCRPSATVTAGMSPTQGAQHFHTFHLRDRLL